MNLEFYKKLYERDSVKATHRAIRELSQADYEVFKAWVYNIELLAEILFDTCPEEVADSYDFATDNDFIIIQICGQSGEFKVTQKALFALDKCDCCGCYALEDTLQIKRTYAGSSESPAEYDLVCNDCGGY